MTILVFYRLYRIWFLPDDEYNDMVKKNNKIPSWYPFKEFSTMILQDKEAWVSKSKTTTTFAAVAIIGIDILAATAFIIGQ